ncbi:MAG: glycosyltransferase [Bacteriovoracaceae bacterium]|nr:glycosyltransferase [Bacteroidota bacterium]
MNDRKKILLLSSRVPYPPIGGDRLRVYRIIRSLSKYYDVDLVTINEGVPDEESLAELRKIVGTVRCFSFSPITFKLNALWHAVLHRGPLQIGYYWFSSVKHYIDSVYLQYDLAFCFHIRMTEYVKDLPMKRMVDLVDSISMNYERALEKNVGLIWGSIYRYEQRKVLQYEKEITALFDKAMIIAHTDKNYLVHHGARSEALVVIPNGTDFGLELNDHQPVPEDIDFLFLGNMETQSNQAAALFFARDVLPLVKIALKRSVTYYIVGKNPSEKINALHDSESIVVTGFVPDPKEYLRRAKIIVAPMLFGAGMQNKILEAMALGKTVITSSIGSAGINGVDGIHYIVADKPEFMAKESVRLLCDPNERQTIGGSARQFINSNYRWERIDELVKNEIDRVLHITSSSEQTGENIQS